MIFSLTFYQLFSVMEPKVLFKTGKHIIKIRVRETFNLKMDKYLIRPNK